MSLFKGHAWLLFIITFFSFTCNGQADIYGAQWKHNSATVLGAQASLSWMRVLPAVEWWEIEPVQNGGYHWHSGYDTYLSNAVSNGLTPIVTFQGTPTWAQKQVPGAGGGYCQPVDEAYITDFYDFVYATVMKYKSTGVKYWEIWNEPDAHSGINHNVFGCWGAIVNEQDGLSAGEMEEIRASGRYYAKFLIAGYNAVKAADPSAIVLCGGLLMSLGSEPNGSGSASLHFFDGIMQHITNVGHPGFDMISYHSYAAWWGPGKDWDALQTNDCIVAGGGNSRVLCRYKALKDKVNSYGRNPPILMSEGGTNCGNDSFQQNCSNNRALFEADKANQYVRMTTRVKTTDIKAFIWYTLTPEWRMGHLLEPSGSGWSELPGYQAIKKAAGMLSGSEYIAPIGGTGTNYEGYLFRKGNKDYRVYWTAAGDISTTEVMPYGVSRYVKMDGSGYMNDLSIPGTASIDFGPLIIESNKANVDIRAAYNYVINGKLVQAYWRGNYGFPRTVPIVNGSIKWGNATSWKGPFPHTALPGNGDIQAQSTYTLGNKLFQEYWRGNELYYRNIPIVNGKVQWGAAPSFSGPISVNVLPGSGDIQARSTYVLGNRLYQAYWRGNKGYYRSVPIVNGNVQWGAAPPYKGPTSINNLPGSGDIQSTSNYVLGNKLHQKICRGNVAYSRAVPIINNQVQWGAAPAFNGPITLTVPVGPR